MVEEEGPHNEVIDRTASGFRREGTDPNPVPPGVRHAWQRPDLGRGVFRWRPLQVAMAVLCVAILIVSSLWVGGSGRQGQSHIAPLATGLGANSSIADPYLINASMFPAASALPNTTDHSSLPKLAYLNAGTFDLWGLLYVDSDMVGNNWLTFRTGFYNATLAQEILLGTGCPQSCPPTAPIQWNAPVAIYDFGNVPVQSNFLATWGSVMAIAATSQNVTYAWDSSELGSNGTWNFLTGTSGVGGADGKIAIGPCGILLTTLTSTRLMATTWSSSCGAFAMFHEPHNGGLGPIGGNGGVGKPLVLYPTPQVTSVTPLCGPTGGQVVIGGGPVLPRGECDLRREQWAYCPDYVPQFEQCPCPRPGSDPSPGNGDRRCDGEQHRITAESSERSPRLVHLRPSVSVRSIDLPRRRVAGHTGHHKWIGLYAKLHCQLWLDPHKRFLCLPDAGYGPCPSWLRLGRCHRDGERLHKPPGADQRHVHIRCADRYGSISRIGYGTWGYFGQYYRGELLPGCNGRFRRQPG